MLIQENISLKPYNTLGVDAKARYFLSVTAPDRLVRPLAETLMTCPLLF